jgi:hypothetical protein
MKKVAVYGANGNMGTRYCKILERYAGCEVVRIDITDFGETNIDDTCDGFIIATPTNTHVKLISALKHFNKPILCEKPITKSILDLEQILTEDIDLSMINQYEFLDDVDRSGDTSYDYFKTGTDGLIWDCINVIGTARAEYNVSNHSLIWQCKLNGRKINLEWMDEAYIRNICAWTEGWRNKGYILDAHKKVSRLLG